MTDPKPTKRGRTAPILSGIAAFLLIALLGAPGYIAGYYCKLARDNDTAVTIGLWADLSSPSNGALRIFLSPAALAAKIAPPLHEIYWKQFVAGSGITFSPPVTWSTISGNGFTTYSVPRPTPSPPPGGK